MTPYEIVMSIYMAHVAAVIGAWMALRRIRALDEEKRVIIAVLWPVTLPMLAWRWVATKRRERIPRARTVRR